MGGWNNAHMMGMSMGVVWDNHTMESKSYHEGEVDALVSHLQSTDLVVGFNLIGFDYNVLRGYSQFDFKTINTLDMLQYILKQLR